MIWLYGYVGVGLALLVLYLYVFDDERPPAGAWCNFDYVLATVVLLLAWPVFLYALVRRRLR